MGILTADMKRVVEEQRLGFFATVCADGTPNVSPKGTTAVWDDDHLVFANIRSPGSAGRGPQQGKSPMFLSAQPHCSRTDFRGSGTFAEAGKAPVPRTKPVVLTNVRREIIF
jgi:hypothetical protein